MSVRLHPSGYRLHVSGRSIRRPAAGPGRHALRIVPVLAPLAVATLVAACGGSGASKVSTVKVVLTPGGCNPRPASIPAGKVTVHVVNRNAEAVSDMELRTGDLTRIVGEQENITPGISGSFTVTLHQGRYVVYCDGAARPESLLTVRG
jgi:iron uptake system component EfeO